MCRRADTRKIPLAEVWKRRFVLCSISLVILTLIGVVMLAVELTKLQRNFYNLVTTVGFSMSTGSTLPLYVIFGYTILRHDQYPTGPVLIWGNALYMLVGTTEIGAALVCVAYVVPADSMFHTITFDSMDANKDYSGGYESAENVTTTDFHTILEKDITIRVNDKEMQAVWNEELICVIQVRVTALGGGIFALGLFGGAITLIVIYRTHRFIEDRKEAELVRRKNIRTLTRVLKPRNPAALRRLRGSVYDYAGWGNRTTDIYHEPENDGRGSATPSVLSTKLTSASLVSATDEVSTSSQNKRSLKNHENHLEKIGELSYEQLNGEYPRRMSSRDRSYETLGASSYEMKELYRDTQNDSTND